jgi:hypothetical protein
MADGQSRVSDGDGKVFALPAGVVKERSELVFRLREAGILLADDFRPSWLEGSAAMVTRSAQSKSPTQVGDLDEGRWSTSTLNITRDEEQRRVIWQQDLMKK